MKRSSIRVNRPGGMGGHSSFNIFGGEDSRFPDDGLYRAQRQRKVDEQTHRRPVAYRYDENHFTENNHMSCNLHYSAASDKAKTKGIARGGSVTGSNFSVKVARSPGGGSSFSPFTHAGQPEYGGRWGKKGNFSSAHTTQPFRLAPTNFINHKGNDLTTPGILGHNNERKLKTSSVHTLAPSRKQSLCRYPPSSIVSDSYQRSAGAKGIGEPAPFQSDINHRNRNKFGDFNTDDRGTKDNTTFFTGKRHTYGVTALGGPPRNGNAPESATDRLCRLQFQLANTDAVDETNKGLIVGGMVDRRGIGGTGMMPSHPGQLNEQWDGRCSSNSPLRNASCQEKRDNNSIQYSYRQDFATHTPAAVGITSSAPVTGPSQCIKINANHGKYRSQIRFG